MKIKIDRRIILKDIVVDLIRHAGSLKAIIYDGSVQKIIEHDQFVISDENFIISKSIPGRILLPTNIGAKRSTKELIQKTEGMLKRVIKLENNDDYLVMALFVMSTYLVDLTDHSFYLASSGPRDRGKSEFLSGIHKSSYFPYRLNGATTIAALTRIMDKTQCTLFVDEFQGVLGKATSEAHMIFTTGFSREEGVLGKCVAAKNGDFIEKDFFIYGFKAMSTRTMPNDTAISSRTYEIQMANYSPNELPKERTTDGIWGKEAESLRNDLLFWSQRVILKNIQLNHYDILSRSKEFGLQSRDFQIFKMPFSICPDEETLNRFLRCLKRRADHISDQVSDCIDHAVLLSLYHAKLDNPGKPVKFFDIASKVNDYTGERISPREVGKLLKAFNLPKKRVTGGAYACNAALATIEEVLKHEGVKYEKV